MRAADTKDCTASVYDAGRYNDKPRQCRNTTRHPSGLCYNHRPPRKFAVIKNCDTGSELRYEVERPPQFTLSYVTVQDGQLVFVREPLSELPDIVREFLESMK